MATPDPTDGQPASATDSEPHNGHSRILRTRRLIPACRGQPRRHGSLVESDQGQGRPCQHDSNSSVPLNSASNSSNLLSYAAGFARTSRSRGCSRRPSSGSHRVLRIARNRLFSRFRSTIVCLCFGTTIANRGFRFPVELMKNKSSVAEETRCRDLNIERISAELLRRADLGYRRRAVTAPVGRSASGSDAMLPANFIAHR